MGVSFVVFRCAVCFFVFAFAFGVLLERRFVEEEEKKREELRVVWSGCESGKSSLLPLLCRL